MSKSRIKSKWNNTSINSEPLVSDVITKPNQSMSIKDILHRNTTGMAYDGYKSPYYEEEAQFSSRAINKIQDMEPVEKLQYLADVKSQVTSLSKKIKDDEDAKAKALEEIQAKQQMEVQSKENEQQDSE